MPPRPSLPGAPHTPHPATHHIAGLGHGGTQHYENFPVASWLCPAHLRPAILAIYRFARCADDLADEGDAPAAQRLQDLGQFRQALDACAPGASRSPGTGAPDTRWPEVFGPLAQMMAQHRLPPALLHDLISAFEQDVRHTASGHRYRDMVELLAYCRLSANPVGRLLLHLYGVNDAASLAQSDQICSALQLINFWQDLGVDLSRNRHYLPLDALQRHGVDPATLCPPPPLTPLANPAAQALMAELCQHARTLMQAGAPLALRLPGRVGWELRLVVQGGLLILDRAAALEHRTWAVRPRLRRSDLLRLLWRAWRMGRPVARPIHP